MAKLSALGIVNKVLGNLGETSNLSALTSLSGLSLLVFNVTNEVLYDLAFEDRWQPLEEDGTLVLSTATTSHAKPSDLYAYDTDSFRIGSSKVKFYTPQRLDKEFPVQTDTGLPLRFIDWKGTFRLHPGPGSSVHGSSCLFRYWKNPTPFSTATPAGTCWVPEGFDLTLLSDLITYKVMHYKNNGEASVYYEKVYGNPRTGKIGSMAKFQNLWRSPTLGEGDNIMQAVM